MSLSHHQQHQLHRIEAGLLRSDPQLAAMLGIFGKLSAGQAMPAREQVPARRDRVRQAAALTVQAIILAAAAIGLLLRAILALVLVLVIAAGTRHGRRLPTSGPERTRRSRRADGRQDPAGQN
jgi:hypothetical protein